MKKMKEIFFKVGRAVPKIRKKYDELSKLSKRKILIIETFEFES